MFSSASTWSQVHGAYPMWQMDDTHASSGTDVEHCYHGSTKLPDGRQGLLVDPGAWSNLAGEVWMQNMARKAIEAGLKVSESRMSHPLNVGGVGKGTNTADWEIQVPIAVADTEGSTNMHAYKAPTVRDEGRNLPALLGLQSMSKQNSVLEMAPGHEYLTMPGPGGYTVNWSPGTVRYKLVRAPSGRLILPCDAFTQLNRKPGGLEEPMVTFYGNQVQKSTCEIGTQTESLKASPKEQPRRKQTKFNTQTMD